MPSTSTTSSLVADGNDSKKVDTIILSGASAKDTTRQLVAFAMDGVWGTGMHMLAEHAAHDLKHKNDLAKEKAIDVFETLDIQAAIYRMCERADHESKVIAEMEGLASENLADDATFARRVSTLRGNVDTRRRPQSK